ncbi:hypothetical protein V8B97DRAFT_1915823 [Scleroderma yunnanense]
MVVVVVVAIVIRLVIVVVITAIMVVVMVVVVVIVVIMEVVLVSLMLVVVTVIVAIIAGFQVVVVLVVTVGHGGCGSSRSSGGAVQEVQCGARVWVVVRVYAYLRCTCMCICKDLYSGWPELVAPVWQVLHSNATGTNYHRSFSKYIDFKLMSKEQRMMYNYTLSLTLSISRVDSVKIVTHRWMWVQRKLQEWVWMGDKMKIEEQYQHQNSDQSMIAEMISRWATTLIIQGLSFCTIQGLSAVSFLMAVEVGVHSQSFSWSGLVGICLLDFVVAKGDVWRMIISLTGCSVKLKTGAYLVAMDNHALIFIFTAIAHVDGIELRPYLLNVPSGAPTHAMSNVSSVKESTFEGGMGGDVEEFSGMYEGGRDCKVGYLYPFPLLSFAWAQANDTITPGISNGHACVCPLWLSVIGYFPIHGSRSEFLLKLLHSQSVQLYGKLSLLARLFGGSAPMME